MDIEAAPGRAFASAIDERNAGVAQAAERWGRLAYAAAVAFIANLYASPAFYWPLFEKFRLAVLTGTICTIAVLMRRLTSGRPLQLGGSPAALLFAYAATVPLSYAWTIAPERTVEAVGDIAKLVILYVALANALDTPRRVRVFLVVGALATLAPSIGAIQRWLENDHLVEGYRTAWRGNYADPNRLAMALVLMLPAAILTVPLVRRRWVKAALVGAAVANAAAIVLTHSRSGAVALAVALALSFLRGRRKGRGLVMAGVVLVALVSLAPRTFWQRSDSITSYEQDASFAERERAWRLLMVIVDERPLTGVGANAFLSAWDRFAPLSAGGRHLIAHNIFMEILGEQGAVALLLFAAYCTWLLGRLFLAGRDERNVEARALLAGLTGYLICDLVNGYSRAFNLYAALGAAVVVIAQSRLRSVLAADEARGSVPDPAPFVA